MVQEIYIIDDTTKTIDKIKEIFKEEENEYKFSNITTSEIEIALRNIPSLIIINEDNVTKDIIELCNMIRANEDNSITPIIVESSNPTKEHIFEVMKTSVEYYVLKPICANVNGAVLGLYVMPRKRSIRAYGIYGVKK